MEGNETLCRVHSIRHTWQKHEYWLLYRNDTSILFAPTLRLALVLSARAYSAIADGDLPPGVEDRLAAASSRAVAPVVPSTKAFHLAIGLTMDCTLRCRYCHGDFGSTGQTADWWILEPAIRHAARYASQTPERTLSVSFAVGGEPTMPWSLFIRTVSELREVAREKLSGVDHLFLSMTTNGVYGEQKRAFVAENFSHLTVSLDGSEKIQNLHRPTRGGRDSYHMVAETVRYFRSKPNLRLGIRATVSSVSVNKLPEIVAHFCQEFGAGLTVAFEPMAPIGRAVSEDALQPPDMKTFLDQYLAAKVAGKNLGVVVTSSAPSLANLRARFCGAMGIPSFAVCVGGAVTACHRDANAADYGYGNIDAATGTIVLDEERIKSIARLNDLPACCEPCFAKHFCAGDCPDLRRIGFPRCDFNRALLWDEIVEECRGKGGLAA